MAEVTEKVWAFTVDICTIPLSAIVGLGTGSEDESARTKVARGASIAQQSGVEGLSAPKQLKGVYFKRSCSTLSGLSIIC